MVSWGYHAYNTTAVDQALHRLEEQRAMFDRTFYSNLGATWFASIAHPAKPPNPTGLYSYGPIY